MISPKTCITGVRSLQPTKQCAGHCSVLTQLSVSAATLTYSTGPDLDMTLLTLPDIVRRRPLTEFKMVATEMEAKITIARNELLRRFQRLSQYLHHAGSVCNTPHMPDVE